MTRWRTSVSLRAALTTVLGKLLSLGVAIAAGPLMIRTVGVAGYGCFATLVSLAAFVDLADLGVGNGLISQLAGTSDPCEALPVVRRAAIVAGTAGAVGIALVALLGLGGAWSAILAAPEALHQQVTIAALTAGTALFINVPAGLGAKVLAGRGRVQTVAYGGVALASLQAIAVLTVGLEHGSLAAFAAAYFLPQCLVAGYLARRALSALNTGLLGLLRAPGKPVGAGDNWSFLGLSALALFAYGTDTLIIAQVLGERSVAVYAVGFRLFTVAPVFLALALQVLWPAYANAAARGDAAWIRRRFRLSLQGSVALNTAWALAMFLAGPAILHAWIGGHVTTPALLRLALAGYVVVNGFISPLAVLLNGIRAFRFQLVAASVMTVLNVGLSVGLTAQIGVSGPLWGTVIAQSICIVIPGLFFIRRWLRTMPGRAQHAGARKHPIARVAVRATVGT